MATPEVGGGRYDQFKTAEEYKELQVEAGTNETFPTQIEKSDIAPHAIKPGETELVLQRHGKYIRNRKDPDAGHLTPESRVEEKSAAHEYFQALLNNLPEEERDKVDVLFVASDTAYFNKGQRSYETAILAQEAATEVFESFGLPRGNILNASRDLRGDGGPRPMPKLREPNMLNKSPKFLDFMLKEYGDTNLEFWIAFEEDAHKDVRERMGAEGPDEIADRMGFSIRALGRYAEAHHRANPGRRLIIWGATHYDTISPFVKRDVFHVGKEQQLLVDYGAGITIDIGSDGTATTEIAGKQYLVPMEKVQREAR